MSSQVSSTIKIGALNAQSGIETTKGSWQYLLTTHKYFLPHSSEAIRKISDFINSEDLDIITFSEIEGGSFRSKNINQLDLISKFTNLTKKVFFPTVRLSKLFNQGNALCSRYPIIKTENTRLPGMGEPRYLGKAIIEIDGAKITVLTTHLSLNQSTREEQIQYIANTVNKTNGPLILAGDFNIKDISELELIDKTRLRKTPFHKTYPSWNPQSPEDMIFFSPEFELIKSYPYSEEKFSDHLPIIAELKLNV
ncbi:MAG: endonuclease/exonuclease/phosphatase family protein [archaeon]|jgi:endonuclease/exonuclease/phosphatase family metal-dependent hydrolase|nr:endonuclease/exonuclease/phosphatase family protein [archaeon]